MVTSNFDIISNSVTTSEAARLLKVHRCTVYRWVNHGWLVGVRLPNNSFRITMESIKTALSGVTK